MRWRGGNQKPNIVGARNDATKSWAARATAQRPAVSSVSRTPVSARERCSRCERQSHHSAGEGEREHGGPAEQAVVAVDEEGHQAVGPVEVAAGEGGVGGRLAGVVGV